MEDERPSLARLQQCWIQADGPAMVHHEMTKAEGQDQMKIGLGWRLLGVPRTEFGQGGRAEDICTTSE
jgi:hypothetical protein